jgi:elongation factor P
MLKAGNITRGMFLNWHNQPVLVVDKEFYNPGKGSAVVRLKLKNLKTNQTTKEVLPTNGTVQEVAVEHKKMQFLYQMEKNFVFVDPRTFEQLEVPQTVVGEDRYFIKEGEEYKISLYQDEPLAVIVPLKMKFTVVETEAGAKGDTVTGATKNVTLDTGLTIKAPIFIKKGEKILVNTETREYVSRA